MSLLRHALPLLAAAGSAYAACSASATATIQNSGDASALASCTTFSGSIAIATGTSDDIALDGIEQIKGNLVATSNSALRRLSGADLKTITGSLEITDVSQLSNLEFPKLKEIDTFKMSGLPNLQELGFTAEVEKCSKIDIQNTFLNDLTGVNIEEAESIFIANNPQIGNISMQLGNVSEQMTISFNNADVNVSFPNLIWANNLTFRACGSVDLPSLESLNSSFGVYQSNLEKLIAPNLTHISGALAIINNTNLNQVSFPVLKNVDEDLQITNNTELHDLTGFPKLEQVQGALDLSGNITKISTPNLNFVKGVFNLQSTSGDIQQNCTDFYDPLRDKGRLPKTKYECKGSLTDPGTAGTKPQSSGKPTGAAMALGVEPTYMGLAGLLAVFFL
jgi:hypothetical protein